jgi:WD40 repeat protein
MLCSQDGVLRVWNFSSGQCLHECLPPSPKRAADGACEITTVLGLSAGPYALFGGVGWSREVWLWRDDPEANGRRVECMRVLAGHTEDILCAAFFHPLCLATGGCDGMLVVWNLESCTVRARLVHNHANNSELPRPTAVEQAPPHTLRHALPCLATAPTPSPVLTPTTHPPPTSAAVEQLTFVPMDEALQTSIDESTLTGGDTEALPRGAAAGGPPPPLVVTAAADGLLRLWSSVGAAVPLLVMPLLTGGAPLTSIAWSSGGAIDTSLLLAGDARGCAPAPPAPLVWRTPCLHARSAPARECPACARGVVIILS